MATCSASVSAAPSRWAPCAYLRAHRDGCILVAAKRPAGEGVAVVHDVLAARGGPDPEASTGRLFPRSLRTRALAEGRSLQSCDG